LNFGTEKNLQRLKVALLLAKTWRYLRYCHAREAMKLLPDVSSVLVVGAGTGLAEIALALEFRHIRFLLTDYAAATHTLTRAKDLVSSLKLDNVEFQQLDILAPDGAVGKFDLTYSVEVLEHIKDDVTAAGNLRALSSRYVFTLVPFADAQANNDREKRQRVWEKNEHYVVGYDSERLTELFPNPIAIRGCYWKTAGQAFRAKLQDMTPEFIKENADALGQEALADLLIDRIPQRLREALGIWIVSRAN
jgi:SAM-dependent methyltransferase